MPIERVLGQSMIIYLLSGSEQVCPFRHLGLEISLPAINKNAAYRDSASSMHCSELVSGGIFGGD